MSVFANSGRVLHDLYLQLNALSDFVTHIDEMADFPFGEVIRHFTSRNKQKGVTIIGWHVGFDVQAEAYAMVKLRTRGSGYRTMHRSRLLTLADVSEVVRRGVEALSYVPLDPAVLPPPWTFSPDRYEVAATRTGWFGRKGGPAVKVNSVISLAEVIKVVTVGVDGVLSDVGIENPEQECWYLMDCEGHSEATFNIITDGEVFYPTTRVTQGTRTIRFSDGSKKKTVDLRRAGIADKELINRAIEEWVVRMTK